MTTFTFEHLAEPKLQFGQYFEHQDTKTGLAECGPFGLNIEGLHPSEIKVGFIGTRETIAGAKEWLEMWSRPIESENIRVLGGSSHSINGLFGEMPDQSFTRVYKILNRDFVGFNSKSPFQCRFQTNERWERSLNPRTVERILKIKDKLTRIQELVGLISGEIQSLATTTPLPAVIILALTDGMTELADSVSISGNYTFNFRRAIKASTMQWHIPLQLLQQRTVLGKDPKLQEKTLCAWNFCTAQYYKTDGVPWRSASIAPDTCFIGISFYVAQDLNDQQTVRTSVAQAFDFLGQGLVLRGDPFAWDKEKQGASPHLTREAASVLMKKTLAAYLQIKGMPPKRVVVHKTSEFWGAEHGQYNELDGFYEGIESVFAHCEVDLVTLRQTGLHLFREGNYPPLRGMYFTMDGKYHYLFTMGVIPYFNTYPGPYVPEPWYIADHHGGSAPKDLFREILTLTKMNVNNCNFADGIPITLAFSRQIGEIMKHIPEDGTVQPMYKFYM
jgi:hypothetical protein